MKFLRVAKRFLVQWYQIGINLMKHLSVQAGAVMEPVVVIPVEIIQD